MIKDSQALVAEALVKTNAHGLARLVNEKRVYTRVLWLLAWLVCCGLFIRQLVGFIGRLQANDVTTNYRADEVPFEYPDLFICFDNPMSGSRHLAVSQEFIAMVNRTLQYADAASESWCNDLPTEYCDAIQSEYAELRMNSMSYQKLADEMGHTEAQSIIYSFLIRTNGLAYDQVRVEAKPFYHPKHLRCFNISLNSTQREAMRFTGPDDALFIMAIMDAPDNRMGRPFLPVISGFSGNLTAPYWALDTISLSSRVRNSNLRIYVTRPGYYPSDFDENVVLESGRNYNVQLEMREQLHTEDPAKCIENPPRVQMVNPYDNSAYSVPYDYGSCYIIALQAQFRRLLNASLGYLPQPWPPTDRLLYNLSSEWGSARDIQDYLINRYALNLEEPLEVCRIAKPCLDRTYSSQIRSTNWPVESMITEVENVLIHPQSYEQSKTSRPALDYLLRISASKNYTQELREYLQANLLQIEISISKSMADRVIFTRAYSPESFMADVGGILGIYLGMSVLTACEVIQFLHDLVMLCYRKAEVRK